MDWPIRSQHCVGQSPFHGWVIRPSARTDCQAVGKPHKNGKLNHDSDNPSYDARLRMSPLGKTANKQIDIRNVNNSTNIKIAR
jgi:hypothetical protein